VRIIALICSLLVLLAVSAGAPDPAQAETKTFGPFSVDDAQPNVVRLDGDIDGGAALNFRRALTAAPKAELLVLNSTGGLVSMGLLIADDVHARKLATLIPEGSGCYSACALIFLAGVERRADGELGVHQISSDTADLVSAQYSISDILDVLNRFDTPIEVLTIMFKTRPEDMHVFSQAEIDRYRINRTAESPPESPADETVLAQPGASQEPIDAPADAEASVTELERKGPELDSASLSRLSALEEFTRRPTRLALYSGLDFFGEDIASMRVADGAACAAECVTMSDRCRAFTFNTDDRITRGPNCFLKSDPGIRDGNGVAISGQLLRASDPAPKAFSMGVIDPGTDLYENIDIPGGDLSRRPYAEAANPFQCRVACVASDQCVAFTYVKRKNECWLKGTVGQPRTMQGVVSGAKRMQTFEASTVIDLD
jgi:hypothetical protein